MHYFGRRAGTAFGDYEIGRGDPDGMTEAVGGLFRPLTDYQPYSGDRVMRTGYWGLAPLVDNPIARGPAVDERSPRAARALSCSSRDVPTPVGSQLSLLRPV